MTLININGAHSLTNAFFSTGNSNAPTAAVMGSSYHCIGLYGQFNANSFYSANWTGQNGIHGTGNRFTNIPANAKNMFTINTTGGTAFGNLGHLIGGGNITSATAQGHANGITQFSWISPPSNANQRPAQTVSFGANLGFRTHYHQYYPQIAIAIFAGAAGIYDDQIDPVISDVTVDVSSEDKTATVTVEAMDELGGSGIKAYEFYRIVNGEFVLAASQTDNKFTFTGLTVYPTANNFKVIVRDWAGNEAVSVLDEVIVTEPITSLRINGIAIETVRRNQVRQFTVNLNAGASAANVEWSTSNQVFAAVDSTGVVTVKNVIGTVTLTAKDPLSGLSHSILLRISS
jgi:hypothetical protein